MAITLATLIGAGLTAAGTGVDYYNAQETNKKQQNAELTVQQNQQAKQKQAAGIVQQQINNVSKSNPAAESAKATQGFIDTLRQNSATATAAQPGLTGNANKKYAGDVAANTANANSYAGGLATDMAGIVAPQRQRMDEGQGFMNTATDVGGVQQAAARQNFVDQLRAKSITQNPWLSLTGKVLQGAGTAVSLGGAAAPAAGLNTGGTALTTGTGVGVGDVGSQLTDPNYWKRYAVNTGGNVSGYAQ